ncbi:MAG: DUF2461 domain-containing protein [Bacteroidales bacterium]|jgi:uncharacterized protein (TIGR02453 family)|nr:DUF2461 domain-containing protein [Bacteroidales bacterium]
MQFERIISFLQELNKNNNREWFAENRAKYDDFRLLTVELTEHLLSFIKSFDANLSHIEPKQCMYRIYRDIRFSKDKTPYKTHVGFFFSARGRSGAFPGYYLHIEDGKSFVGGGIHVPPVDDLKNLRQEIYYNMEEFLDIFESQQFSSFYKELSDYGKLKTAPRDYDIDYEHIDVLNNKSFVVSSAISNELLFSEKGLDYVKNAFFALKPLIDFLSRVYD